MPRSWQTVRVFISSTFRDITPNGIPRLKLSLRPCATGSARREITSQET